MDYSSLLRAIDIYIETRLKTPIEYNELSLYTGFSAAHLRDVFKEETGKSLSAYILERRIKNSAFDIVHSDRKIFDIAFDYQFNNPDTFTRAFRRITGYNPGDFRRMRIVVGSSFINGRFFGIDTSCLAHTTSVDTNEVILYGVPYVGFGQKENTPLAACIKACANYLGEDVDYDFMLTACGAAFRLTWDTGSWYGGNIDICYTYDDEGKIYEEIFKCIGREYRIVGRRNDTEKSEFKEFIIDAINSGYPCLAQGIIGPPEVCIICGYRNGGEILLGRNFFQDNISYRGNRTRVDDTGYFICEDWWENPSTQSLMTFGDKVGDKAGLIDVLRKGREVLSGHYFNSLGKGTSAYDPWIAAIKDDVSTGDIMQSLAEKYVCHYDAVSCIYEGRSALSHYFGKASSDRDLLIYADELKSLSLSCKRAADKSAEIINITGGWSHKEENLHRFADKRIRDEVCFRIEQCREIESITLTKINDLYYKLVEVKHHGEP